MSAKYRIIPLGGGGMDPSTKYGASISMSMDQDYILSVQLLDQDGNALGSEQTVDLPLESVVVGGSYDSATKSLILTLDNGNTVTIPVGDLVSGLQTEITAQNPLSADLVADGTNNKVFTAAEQTKLSGIEAGAQVNPANVSAFNNDAGYLTQSSVIINQAFPSGWHTSGTLSQLITDINADTTAVKGKSYLSTVSFSDLPASLVQGEMTVQIMDEMAGTGKVILFTLTSSATAPYHWEYTSAWGGTSQWREWALSTDVVNADWNATSGKAEILNKPTIPAAANDATITVHQDGQADQTFTLNQSGDQTINIAAGGGGNAWYGTQAQFDALQSYDTDTTYYISDKIDWSEIANTPTIPTKVSDIKNDAKYAPQWLVDKKITESIKEYDSRTKWVTLAEYTAMELGGTLEEGVAYHIEGPQTSVQMVVTFTDQSTATYDVYVGSIS